MIFNLFNENLVLLAHIAIESHISTMALSLNSQPMDLLQSGVGIH